jgi:hypothetical protein
VFTIPDPDGYLSASEVKDVAQEVITPLPLPGVEGSPFDPGDIWLVVILACTNQNSIWDTCNDTDGTPCDDIVLTWLHTLDWDWLEFVANLLLGRLAVTIYFFRLISRVEIMASTGIRTALSDVGYDFPVAVA